MGYLILKQFVMKKFKSKGLEILKRRDGKIEYKPYAIYEDYFLGIFPYNIKYYIRGHYFSYTFNSIYDYFLSTYGDVTRDSIKDATELLEDCVKWENDKIEKRNNEKIIKKAKIIIP